jgi:hypothetical protein
MRITKQMAMMIRSWMVGMQGKEARTHSTSDQGRALDAKRLGGLKRIGPKQLGVSSLALQSTPPQGGKARVRHPRDVFWARPGCFQRGSTD